LDHWIDSRARIWAVIAIIAGLGVFVGIEWLEEPESTPRELFFELLKVSPVVLTSVGVVLLFRVSRRQRDDHLQVLRDLEIARLQGRRWRDESRSLLQGLGQAMDAQFSRWNLTDAERDSRIERAHGARAGEGGVHQVRSHRAGGLVGVFSRRFAGADRRARWPTTRPVSKRIALRTAA
jgi:hypothetical protein